MNYDSVVPPVHVLLDDFSERHLLAPTDLLRREGIAIQSLSVANILVNEAYGRLDELALGDPAIGLLLNLLHRNFEHAEACIVAFATGCGSSAEIVARASVEASVNIMYILAGDRAARLLAYFNHYLDGVDRQIDKWLLEVSQLGPDDAKLHKVGIDQRRAANAVVRQVVHSLGIKKMERWPSQIAQRFEAIGDAMGYRTFYARMSSEVHGDAEETLRYFIGKVVDGGSFLEKMALESVWTSRFYTYFAVSYQLRASLAYVRSYSLSGVEPRLEGELGNVERELMEISAHIGADL